MLTGIAARKPWRLKAAQSPFSGSHTIYVGGTAGYETVEDSLQFNLELVHDLFDAPPPQQRAPQAAKRQAAATAAEKHALAVETPVSAANDRGWPGPAAVGPRLEQLRFSLPCGEARAFVAADAATWTNWLARRKGFVRKAVLFEPADTTVTAAAAASATADDDGGNCTVWSAVQWASLELWSAAGSAEDFGAVAASFDAAFSALTGSAPPEAVPYPADYPAGSAKAAGGARLGVGVGSGGTRVGLGGVGLPVLVDVPLPIDAPFPVRTRLRAKAEVLNLPWSPNLVSSGATAEEEEEEEEEEAPLTVFGPGAAAAAAVSATPNAASAVEVIKIKVASCGADDVASFLAADNATWTAFLAQQPGFVRKITLLEEYNASASVSSSGGGGGGEGGESVECWVWTRTSWATLASMRAVPEDAKASTAADFAALLGYSPPMRRVPEGGYLTVLVQREAARGPRTAVVGGVDLVAFSTGSRGGESRGSRGSGGGGFLVPGVDGDVRGSAAFAVELPSDFLLPPQFVALHPEPYAFWFSSAANAAAFSADPLAYLPGVGGHCTHGLASEVDGTIGAVDLVDGRLAFVCVNTTTWGGFVNGTLFMNSCGMYDDFTRDPEGDAAAATALWRSWFGDFPGPMNDACVQDGATWEGPSNCETGLLPPACNIY